MPLHSFQALRCSKIYRVPSPTSLTWRSAPLRFHFPHLRLQQTSTQHNPQHFSIKQPNQTQDKYELRQETEAIVRNGVPATTNTATVGQSTSRSICDELLETFLGPPLSQGTSHEERHPLEGLARFVMASYRLRPPQYGFRQRALYRELLLRRKRTLQLLHSASIKPVQLDALGQRVSIRKSRRKRTLELLHSASVKPVQLDALAQSHTASDPSISVRKTTARTRSRWTADDPTFDGMVSAKLNESRTPSYTDCMENIDVEARRINLHRIEISVQGLRAIQKKENFNQNTYSEKFTKSLIYTGLLWDWSRFMLWLLEHKSTHEYNPWRALALLDNTLAQTLWTPPHYQLRDVFCYLTRLFLDDATQAKPIVTEKLYRACCAYLHTCKPGNSMEFIFIGGTFYLLLQHFNEDQFSSMLQAFEKLDIFMPPHQMFPAIILLLDKGREKHALDLFRVFGRASPDAESTDEFRSTCARLLLERSTQEDQFRLVLQATKFLNISMSTDHMLGALHRFIDKGRVQGSLDLLHEFGQKHPNQINSDQFQSTCVRLLRLRPKVWNWYQMYQNVLSQVLNTGIRPNITLVNVMLFTAFEAEDYQTAWQIFKTAKDNGLQPDESTYSIVLNGAKYEGNGKELEAAIQGARGDGFLFKNERVACDVLHATFLYQFKRSSRPFDLLVPIYNTIFTNSLLIELGMLSPDYKPPEFSHFISTGRPPIPLLEPSPRAVTHMIFAYLIQGQGRPFEAFNLYRAYTSLVAANHPTIAALIETAHISSAFVKAIGHHHETLHFCTTIVENMLSPPPNWPTAEHPPAPPNVVTWSTLLAAFLFRGQRVAAQRILEMMRERSMRPNTVTWNSMVSGYGNMQDVERAVGTVVTMQKEGCSIDEWTLKGLGRIIDKKKLMQELKKATGRNAEDFTGGGWIDREELNEGIQEFSDQN